MAENHSQWSKVVNTVPEQQIHMIYNNVFPLEVRHFLTEWIEEQSWNAIDVHNEDHRPMAANLRDQFVHMLRARADEMTGNDLFLTKLKLRETARQFEESYKDDPMTLINIVKRNLHQEQQLMIEFSNLANGQQGSMDVAATRHMKEQFEYLTKRTQASDVSTGKLQQRQETFVIKYQESASIQVNIDNITRAAGPRPDQPAVLQQLQQLQRQKQHIDRELAAHAQELLKTRLELQDEMQKTVGHLTSLQHHIMDQKVIGWKREQQLAGNGQPFESNLDELQAMCMRLADLIWLNRHQVKKMELLRQQLPINLPSDREDLLPQLNKTITSLLSSLVTNTFIIEKQPPQVLKKDSRFQATVRLLVGSRFNVHLNPPTVKASIISEEQARALLTNERATRNESCGNILNAIATMEYNSSTEQLSVTFRNMALKTIKRAEKKGNETVTEEKFCILFQSQFTAGGGELVFQVWTLSVPVVVTVHGNQECNALATVLWDNAFAAQGRTPFVVPDKVLWPQLAATLNTKFLSQCHRGLSHENLQYLASKLFGPMDDYSNQYVTWTQFNREALTGRNFTFWEWFYALLKLTKDWLQGPWKEGHIIGFLSKEQSQLNLKGCNAGTFLLRFSDSELGGITIAWTHEATPGEKTVLNLAPFTDRDFKVRLLGDHIKDLNNLTTLYPCIPKNTAFSQFWTANSDSRPVSNGYVGREINTVIPGMAPVRNIMDTAQPMNEDNPSTPLPISCPYSPESTMSEAITEASINEASNLIDNVSLDQNWTSQLATIVGDYRPEDMTNDSDMSGFVMDDMLGSYNGDVQSL